MGFFQKIGETFTNTKAGAILNPAGYMLAQKPASEMARLYALQYPPSAVANAADSELSFKEDARRWVEDCAADGRNKDKMKSMKNLTGACQSCFDNDPAVIDARDGLVIRAEDEIASIKAQTQANAQKLIYILAAVLIIALLIYLFTSD